MNSQYSEKILIFIKEFNSIFKFSKIRIKDLYQSYSSWCRRNGEHRLNKPLFCQLLEELGFKHIKLGNDEGFDLSILEQEIEGGLEQVYNYSLRKS